MKQQKKMAYKKPRLIAKNNPTGSFAAGCPTERGNGQPGSYTCSLCEVSG